MAKRKTKPKADDKLKPGDKDYKHILVPAKSLRDEGLVHSMRYVSVEDVSKAMKKVCDVCGEVPVEKRLLVKSGSGRSQKAVVLCVEHGGLFLDQMSREAWRAYCRLHGDGTPVRFVGGELEEDRNENPRGSW